MNHDLLILFYLKKDKLDAQGKAPIYVRLTVGGQRAGVATKRGIEPERWDNATQKVKGTKEDARTLNAYLDSLRQKLSRQFTQLLNGDEPVTVELLKNTFLEKVAPSKTLLQLLDYYNSQAEARIGIDFVVATTRHYRVSARKVQAFLQHQYQRKDMPLDQLSHRFATEFEHYLKTEQGLDHNTVMGHLKYVKKVVGIAVTHDWLDKNPFQNFRCSTREVARQFLTAEEMTRLAEKPLAMRRLAEVRDIFIFACYTGYAYSDVAKLTPDHVLTGIDGEKWIMTRRNKTDTKSNVPLLPQAMAVVQKYAQDPECLATGRLLPVKSNQKLNAYLKELADLCEIKKPLTFHIARHTFATTVTLTNGVPIETVSSMLGHRNLRTTQIYAKVVEQKVGEDMRRLRDRLSGALPAGEGLQKIAG